MSRINTNIAAMIAQRVLTDNKSALNTSLERLSTGLRINSGKDDPSGLIASESLRAQATGLNQAVTNADRADQVVNIAEGGLEEVSSLLNQVQGLVTQTANTAGLSAEERKANQLQLDSILQTIDRVSSSVSFQGSKLLNGNYDFTTASVSGQVKSFKVNTAKLNFGSTRGVDVVVTASAQVAGYLLSFGANNLDLGGAGASNGANKSFVLEIAGAKGARELSFASGTSLASVAAAINSYTDITGVKAKVSGTTSVRLESSEFGHDQFVSVKVTDDGSINSIAKGIYSLQTQNASAADTSSVTTFSSAANTVKDYGQDVRATINGIAATSKGTTVHINTDFLDVEVNLDYNTTSSTANAAKLGALSAFSITGGGADFQLASRVDISGKVSLGIGNIATREIGRFIDSSGAANFLSDLSSGKALNIADGDVTSAQQVVQNAINEVSSLRGRLGAFQQNTVGASIQSLNVAVENTTAAQSAIRDVDFASETANLTRSQILVSSATQILGLANQQPQSALQLLG